jgi:hypothetical protein
MTEYFSERGKVACFLLLLSLPFLAFCYKYFGFTVDDSFIAWRYSKNLVEYGALTWNPGQDPVEGFTSFLWVILNAGALLFGISPVVFSKGLSILTVLAIVAALLRKGTNQPWYLQLGLPAALALSPAVAVLTIQGLETMFAALLMLATSAISVKMIKASSRNRALLWYGCAFVAGLVRPDTLVFSAGIFVTLVAILRLSNREGLRSFLTLSLPFFALGGGYMAWRVWYFGYLFPNPTYLKGDSLGGGILYTTTFFSGVLAPYLIVGTVAAIRAEEKRLTEILPTLTGAFLFGGYLLNVEPIQGFLWRYAIPVLPALLYCILHLPWPVKPSHWKHQLATGALGAVLLLWPLHTYPTANGEVARHPGHERVAVGKTLQGLEGRLFTSESGAIAYYSEWLVVDYLGLNSEKVSNGTPISKVLEKLNPDLISVIAKFDGKYTSHKNVELYIKNKYMGVLEYLNDKNYYMFMSSKRKKGVHTIHIVNTESKICEKVVDRISNMKYSSKRYKEIDIDEIEVYESSSKSYVKSKVCNFRP